MLKYLKEDNIRQNPWKSNQTMNTGMTLIQGRIEKLE